MLLFYNWKIEQAVFYFVPNNKQRLNDYEPDNTCS